jgi:excinuclease UvrABC nuclease subunit
MLSGKFTQVSSELEKKMRVFSKNKQFEKAGDFRDKINNLEHLLQAPISADEYIVNPNLLDDLAKEALDELISNFKLQISNLRRIEMFDIANLSGTSATGAMTVAIDGQVKSSEYRHFTIKRSSSPNDVEMMREMLNRRLANTSWPKPDLIVLDGGKSQLSVISDQLTVPVFALAKQEEIVYVQNGTQIKLERNNPGLQLLQLLRDEAHRFSRRLHHKHRSATIK